MDDVRMEYSVERGTWNVMVNAEWYYEGYFDHALQVFESFFWNDDQHEVNQGYNEYQKGEQTMKTKVTAVCTHEGSHLINLTFITKEGNPITMYQDCNDPLAGDFANFTALYTTILLRAKWNNFIIPSHKLFGHRVYNIIFIIHLNTFQIIFFINNNSLFN